MYGHTEPTPEVLRQQKLFTEGLDEDTRVEYSNKAVDIGWRALSQKDLGKAMRRFNQGWLLNPKNGRVYWGYAVILWERDRDLNESIIMFEQALPLLPANPAILVDYGRILEDGGRYRQAIEKFKAALAMDENIPPAYYGLVLAHLRLDDVQKAAHYAEMGRKYGIPMSDEEIDELQRLAKKQRE